MIAADAGAQGDGDAVRRPERLTSGVADQLLGQLAPDGRTLVYVSNRNATNEIYAQDQQQGKPHLLFDEGADVTWPRVSPDGKRILYISYRGDAAGQLCVRVLPDKHRQCLANAGSALQAQWIDNQRILLVSRGDLESDLRVWEVKLGWFRLTARPLFDRNLTSPTISPDGKWLVYVPVERYVPRVGPGIASRAAEQLEAVRLDDPGHKITLDPDLPGLSGQPQFSIDGKFLYFTEFFNDSNQDGEIDASDNGVLFRLPFDGSQSDAPERASKIPPQQLTDASWNCQYPSPAKEILIATCSRKNDLEVYSLPLDGQVPTEWSAQRLAVEVELSSREVELLLLYRRELERETSIGGLRSTMMSLLSLHLAAGEFAAAEFYGKKIKAMPDKATAGAASALLTLIEHRKALRERERGRISVEFVEDSRKRLQSLSVEKVTAPAAIALRWVVRSEICDSIGDKDQARRELEAAPIDQVSITPFIDAFYQQADALYRELEDRDALAAAAGKLSENSALEPGDRQRYARAAVRALVRGLPYDAAENVLQKQLQQVSADSEMAFAIELMRILLSVREENPSRELRARLVELYKKQPRLDRKRAVMLDAVQRAVDLEAEKLVEALVKLYVEDTPRGTGERTRAERLYERAMTGRVYRRLARGDVKRAREAFHDIAETTNSIEAHLGYVELSLREGVMPAQLEAEYKSKDEPSRVIVHSYLLTRELHKYKGVAHEQAAIEALKDLRVNATLRGQGPAEVLHGSIHHDRFLEEDDLSAAQRANVHYLLALEQVQRNPRYKARLLGQLALLQSQVGNYRIALSYADEREKLPVVDDAIGLEERLTRARVLFHIEKTEEAHAQAEEALKMIDREKSLAEYRVVALDRAALYALAAGKFDRASALYDEEVPLVASDRHNQVVTRLARAAAALGNQDAKKALADLDIVDRELGDPKMLSILNWPHTTPDVTLRGYQLIASGLRANAHLMLGELDGAARALEKRQALALLRYEKSQLDEHLRALALVEARLFDVARDRKSSEDSAKWIEAALAHADDYVKKTGVNLHVDQLDLLRMGAELYFSTGAKLKLKLPLRMRDAYDKMVSERDPDFRVQQRWFEVYIGMFGNDQN
jgi:hypothetical protein